MARSGAEFERPTRRARRLRTRQPGRPEPDRDVSHAYPSLRGCFARSLPLSSVVSALASLSALVGPRARSTRAPAAKRAAERPLLLRAALASPLTPLSLPALRSFSPTHTHTRGCSSSLCGRRVATTPIVGSQTNTAREGRATRTNEETPADKQYTGRTRWRLGFLFPAEIAFSKFCYERVECTN